MFGAMIAIARRMNNHEKSVPGTRFVGTKTRGSFAIPGSKVPIKGGRLRATPVVRTALDLTRRSRMEIIGQVEARSASSVRRCCTSQLLSGKGVPFPCLQ